MIVQDINYDRNDKIHDPTIIPHCVKCPRCCWRLLRGPYHCGHPCIVFRSPKCYVTLAVADDLVSRDYFRAGM
jgi:hypothetical protein